MTSLSPSLASLRNEFNATTARLHAMADTLDDLAWRAKPGDDRWSTAECVEHLNLTSQAYLPLLGEALREGRARGLTNPSSSNRLDIVGWMLVRSLEPPVKRHRGMKTTEPFIPRSIGPRQATVSRYEELQRGLTVLLADAEGLAISKIKARSAFNPRLRYSVYSALRVIAAHQRRHLWQAEEALKQVRSKGR